MFENSFLQSAACDSRLPALRGRSPWLIPQACCGSWIAGQYLMNGTVHPAESNFKKHSHTKFRLFPHFFSCLPVMSGCQFKTLLNDDGYSSAVVFFSFLNSATLIPHQYNMFISLCPALQWQAWMRLSCQLRPVILELDKARPQIMPNLTSWMRSASASSATLGTIGSTWASW